MRTRSEKQGSDDEDDGVDEEHCDDDENQTKYTVRDSSNES